MRSSRGSEHARASERRCTPASVCSTSGAAAGETRSSSPARSGRAGGRERGRERPERAGFADLTEFRLDDAQTAPLDAAHYDVVFSRFGVMFFADPAAAFANLRRAPLPGGRLAFVCWQAREKNGWMFAPVRAAAKHIPFP